MDASKAGRSYEIERGAAARQMRRGVWLPVGEARTDQGVVVAGATLQIHAGTMVEQDVDHPELNTRRVGRRAGRNETKRRALAASIHLCARIDVGAGLEQDFRNLLDVFRGHLAIALDAVCRNVVQQRGAMLARRARTYQPGIVAEQPSERLAVAVDDGTNGGFEGGDRRR